MAIIYVSPLASGSGTGASAANAMAFSSLNAAVKAAGPGGTVMLLADKGAYNTTGSITITNGGLAGSPITIKGVDSSGNAADVTINGTRDKTWVAGDASGNTVFKLYAGANNITFDGIDFNNVGMAFQLAGDLKNVSLQNLEGDNVRYFIGDYAGGSSTTASVDGLTIRNVEVHGYSKSVILLKYNTHNVVIENVYGNSEYQDGDNFAMGILLDGTVHDVLIKDTTMAGNRASNFSYWNGDGFTTERGVYNVRLENTLSTGNADGGYDLKSSSTVLVNAVAEDNGRNFRLWGQNVQLIDPIGIDPHHQGGTSSQGQIWIAAGATVTVTGGYFMDLGSSTRVIDNDGSINFNGTSFWYAGTLKMGSGSTAGISTTLVHKVTASGTFSANGETYLPTGAYDAGYHGAAASGAIEKTLDGTTGNDILAPKTADHWTIHSLAGNDTITTLGGNDHVFASSGNDLIDTGSGDDFLTGASGADRLTGGSGSDVFDFNAVTDSTPTARDTIVDFVHSVDRIDLASIDANTNVTGNNAFTFIGENVFSGVAGQLRVDHSDSTKTVVYADVNGDKVADFTLTLLGNVNLTGTDFFL